MRDMHSRLHHYARRQFVNSRANNTVSSGWISTIEFWNIQKLSTSSWSVQF